MKIFSKVFLLAIVVVAIFSCVTASAMTEAERQALIAQIQQQINQLTIQLQNLLSQQQGSWCYTFSYNLGFAQSGTEPIAALHIALGKQNISYSPDTINVYALGTEAAVKRFQAKYGISQTGYVGPVTREKLNDLYGCQGTDQDQTTDNNDQTNTDCDENWVCTSWSACINGTQTKSCTDANHCGTTYQKPDTEQDCTVSCSPNWECEAWSACANSTKTRTCTDTKRCNTSNLTKEEFATCCVENWECSQWPLPGEALLNEYNKNCLNQTACTIADPLTVNRTCVDKNNCGTTKNRPPLTQSGLPYNTCQRKWAIGPFSTSCEKSEHSGGVGNVYTFARPVTSLSSCSGALDLYPYEIGAVLERPCQCVPQNWECGAWSTCYNSQQTRTCQDGGSSPCLGADAGPVHSTETRECYSPNAGGTTGTKRAACTASGGTASPRYCSGLTGNFPSTCSSGVGVCSATPSTDTVKQIEVCSCGAGKCWDGATCVTLPSGMTQENVPGYETAPSFLSSYIPKITQFKPAVIANYMGGVGSCIATVTGEDTAYCQAYPGATNCMTKYSCPKPGTVIYSDPSTYQNFSLSWSSSGATYCTTDSYTNDATSGIKYITIMEGGGGTYMLKCVNEDTGFSTQKWISVTFRQY